MSNDTMPQSSSVFLPTPLRQKTPDISDLVRHLPRLLGAEPDSQAVFFHFTSSLGGQVLHSLTVIDLESFLRAPAGSDRHITYTRAAILSDLSTVFAHTKTHTIAVLIGTWIKTLEQNMDMLNRAASTALGIPTVTDAYLLDQFANDVPILRFIPDGNVAATDPATGENATVVVSNRGMSTRMGDLFAHNLDDAQAVRYRTFSEDLSDRLMDFIVASDNSEEGDDDAYAFARLGNRTLVEIADIFAYYSGMIDSDQIPARTPLRDELVCLASLCASTTVSLNYRSQMTILRDAMLGAAVHYPQGAYHVARHLITIAVDPRIKAAALCAALVGVLSRGLAGVNDDTRSALAFADLDQVTQCRVNDMIHAAIMADPALMLPATIRRHLDAGEPIATLMEAITTCANLARSRLTTESGI